MNNLETIQYLAQAEAKHFAPLRNDMHTNLMEDGVPHLLVQKVNQTYEVQMQGHHGHDNEGRAPLICSFVKMNVLAHLDPAIDASGVYPIELHDSYSYLAPDSPAHRAKYRGALTFSKPIGHGHTILFPDPYQITGYGGMLGVTDPLEFDKKQDIVLFAGTTTGDRAPLRNERIKACLWAMDKRPRYQFYITNIAQMTINDMRNGISDPDLQSILHSPIQHADHFQCKYIFNIKGNTCCWSRVPMIMNSNSLMLNLRHSDATWYYPLLQDNHHFVSVPTIESLPSIVQQCASTPLRSKQIVANANQFVKNFCGQVHASYYAKCLFEAMALN
ncbi:hypothetical protein TSOC_000537 [Tetrabaena socialis]|uniref:Glycosyl transferase CAP10 domain-containing protein n=1 Tax=Tetrabaena socialis TaxID=47790 RepID=A0A2J8AJ71_9CHLO|nr:hypothetical protein TSOC_000537 [Tetrabaena socialis]|eukprot:PNH12567.1 hypothetical protein TSOC_000537 [Tetrabaena socialis]